MKQHITAKQLNELSKNGKKGLKKWWRPQYGDQFVFENSVCTVFGEALPAIIELKRRKKDRQIPLLSIGQMLEFLGENWKRKEKRRGYIIDFNEVDDLCDFLWDMVKEILEK